MDFRLMPLMVIAEYTRKPEKRWGQSTSPSGLQMDSMASSQQLKPPFGGALSLPERYYHIAKQIFHTDWKIWFHKQSFLQPRLSDFSGDDPWFNHLSKPPGGLNGTDLESCKGALWSSRVTLSLWGSAVTGQESLMNNPSLTRGARQDWMPRPGCRLWLQDSAKSYLRSKLSFWLGTSALGRELLGIK